MKNLIVLIIGLATALPQSFGKNITTTLDLPQIDKLGLSINASVVIREGANQSIEISGSEDLIDDLNTDVENGNWNIKYESYDNRNSDESLTIEITLNSLKTLAVSGPGSIETKGSFSHVKRRNIALSGTGSIQFKGESDHIDIALSGDGYIDVNTQSEYIHAAVSGTGDIDLSGTAKFVNMAASGSGNIGSPKLKTERCKAAISGSSILTAEVTDDLDIIVSGSGQFHYKGKPKIQKKTSNGGKIKKI